MDPLFKTENQSSKLIFFNNLIYDKYKKKLTVGLITAKIEGSCLERPPVAD